MPSTVIYQIDYDPKSSTLRITYMSGSVYIYKDVPEKVFHEMKEAESKGAYLNAYIKGVYDFERVN